MPDLPAGLRAQKIGGMTRRPIVLALMFAPLLSGCVASSMVGLATAPVRAGARAVNTTADVYDRVTVSQSERDEKRGRQMRQREERYGRLSRDYDRARNRCEHGDEDACEEARGLYGQMSDLRPSVPNEPD
ncbi:hypothetical protein [Novosphingobium percolationis]|uniref:hypothetical protein n=1 Tax=Novosphingobium percolationis TaxID=2871811 RepID=UPI001CD22A46|nr:hypothetical protein [Novosphingobium percolationis]